MLKKKHYLEGLLDQTDTQMDNLAQMVVNVAMVTVAMQHLTGGEYRIHSGRDEGGRRIETRK